MPGVPSGQKEFLAAATRRIREHVARAAAARRARMVQTLGAFVNDRLAHGRLNQVIGTDAGPMGNAVRSPGRAFGPRHGSGPVKPPRPRRPPTRPVSVSYERRGSGQPLVLLHGIGHRWQAWLPVLDHLARHHDVIALDLPGFGDSSVPPSGLPRSMTDLVEAVREQLATLGLDHPHVAGNSLGGAVALELAVRGVVASATAFAPAGFCTPAEARRAFAVLSTLRASTFSPEPALRWAITQPWLRDLAVGALVANPSRLAADRLVDDSLSLRRAKGYLPIGWGLRDYAFTGSPTVPVTVAWGTRDRILPPVQAQRARATLPAARHVTLPGCGHVPMSDAPDRVARVILETTAAA